MTERARRLGRLLAVRELQADLAAAELRLLRGEQDATRVELAGWQEKLQIVPLGASPHGEWLLACAEKEIAGVHAQRLLQDLDVVAARIETQAEEERERSIAREQMSRLCERTEAAARAVEDRLDQGRLDDIFSATRLRRLAHAGEAREP